MEESTQERRYSTMSLGIMQPYFFPYLGHFSLIQHTEKWIVFDTVQYIDRGWMNRNRIIHPDKPEAMYITVPVTAHRDTPICDVRIDGSQPYIPRILGQISASYKKRAPYYATVSDLAASCLNDETENLRDLNVLCLQRTCQYLGIPLHLSIFSQMHLAIDPVSGPDEWALNICKALGETDYLNPPGAMDMFDRKKYADAGVNIRFLQFEPTAYNQKKPLFLPALSVLDAMMFCSPQEIRGMLEQVTLL